MVGGQRALPLSRTARDRARNVTGEELRIVGRRSAGNEASAVRPKWVWRSGTRPSECSTTADTSAAGGEELSARRRPAGSAAFQLNINLWPMRRDCASATLDDVSGGASQQARGSPRTTWMRE